MSSQPHRKKILKILIMAIPNNPNVQIRKKNQSTKRSLKKQNTAKPSKFAKTPEPDHANKIIR